MIIVDASVIYKWLIDEDEPATTISRSILDAFLNKKLNIVVPDILLYELGNIFSFKTKLEESDIRLVWEKFILFHLPGYTPNAEFIKRTIDFSKKYRVSVYDASYAVLAMGKKCNLITADEKFVKQVNLDFIKSLVEYSS